MIQISCHPSIVTEVPVTREYLVSRINLAEGTIAEHTIVNDAVPTTALLGQKDGQEYKCCECFDTFEGDISLGNDAEWVQCTCK